MILNKFLLDTNVPSELTKVRPKPHVTAWLKSQNEQSLFLSVVTISEIRKGSTILPEGKRRTQLEAWLEKDLLSWFAGRILPVSQTIADRWGVLDGNRQLQGNPLNTADGMIAGTALSYIRINSYSYHSVP